MMLDQYQPCLCGSGKKLKFCCSHDILPELDKIIRAVQGQQRAAALDTLNHVITLKGPRAALLVLKTHVMMSIPDLAGAQATVTKFLEMSPTNCIARSLAAMVAASREDVAEAIEKVQRAIETAPTPIPHELYDAIGAVGSLLFSRGDTIGGRAYFELQLNWASDEDTRPAEVLGQLSGHPQLHPALKQSFGLIDCPPGVAWKPEFDRAKELADKDQWWRSCEAFEELASRIPGHPSIRRNLAVLRSRLGNIPLTISAWRAYASTPGVSLEDAADAELLAMLLDPVEPRLVYPMVISTHTVEDTDRLMERLLSEKQLLSVRLNPGDWDSDEGPPPKAVFALLDKLPTTDMANVKAAEIPRILGELFVFGRQTDRAARVELRTARSNEYEKTRQEFLRVVGDLAAARGEERDEGVIEALQFPLRWVWDMPRDLPAAQRKELTQELRRGAIFDSWPKTSFNYLDGKTPDAAAAEPALRIRLLAAIRSLEISLQQQRWTLDLNELREKLGLPKRSVIESIDADAMEIPLIRFDRVDATKMDDDHLMAYLDMVSSYRLIAATRNLAEELLRRPSFEKTPSRAAAFAKLSTVTTDLDEVLDYMTKGREAAEEAGISPAAFLLQELELRMLTGDVTSASRIFERLKSKHLNEPGIGDRVYQLLVRYGLITPDGRMNSPGGPAPAAAAAAPGKLWTPDSPAAAAPPPTAAGPAASEPAKSKLWLPGMD